MIEPAIMTAPEQPIEELLLEELMRGDVVYGTIAPILGYLIANHGQSLFSDQIVAHVRGMIVDIARQLMEAQSDETSNACDFTANDRDALSNELMHLPSLLVHCHALALEAQITAHLEKQNGIDPVLSPLLQALIASGDATDVSLAMSGLAAQARFIQHQGRMELPLGELPGELFHCVLMMWRASDFSDGEHDSNLVERQLRDSFDEATSRICLLARLVNSMGGGTTAALSVSHSGVAIFLSALAISSKQSREMTIVSIDERQMARFALGLRMAGLKSEQIEEQFAHFHPEVVLPEGIVNLRINQAAEMLAEQVHVSSSTGTVD